MGLKGQALRRCRPERTVRNTGRGMNMTLLVAIPIFMTLGLPLALAACPSSEEPWEQQD